MGQSFVNCFNVGSIVMQPLKGSNVASEANVLEIAIGVSQSVLDELAHSEPKQQNKVRKFSNTHTQKVIAD